MPLPATASSTEGSSKVVATGPVCPLPSPPCTIIASAPQRVFSRELLLEKVWSYDYFGDGRIVDVHVRRLRTKIEPDPGQPELLVTVRGLGYKLQP